ncbi:MAG: bifunctional nuclease domain-containing protein [Chitinophagales bacterium]
MKKIELEVFALSHSMTEAQSYAVVLSERKGLRRLPIVIGGSEAQAIAVAMEGMTPTRPLTHDLTKNICQKFNIAVKEVIISNLLGGIFYSTLVCQHEGGIVEIDSRTSDALALAVRFRCPIYTYEFILDQAGIILEEQENDEVQKPVRKPYNDLSGHTIDKLNDLLRDALQQEDYEKAARLRDELKKRA